MYQEANQETSMNYSVADRIRSGAATVAYNPF